jgi:hypothetical protein
LRPAPCPGAFTASNITPDATSKLAACCHRPQNRFKDVFMDRLFVRDARRNSVLHYFEAGLRRGDSSGSPFADDPQNAMGCMCSTSISHRVS